MREQAYRGCGYEKRALIRLIKRFLFSHLFIDYQLFVLIILPIFCTACTVIFLMPVSGEFNSEAQGRKGPFFPVIVFLCLAYFKYDYLIYFVQA